MCAVHSVIVFCGFLNSCFVGVLLVYFMDDFEVISVAPVITGTTFVFALNLLLLFTMETQEIVCTHGADGDDDDDDGALTG
jgi:hypothetical protein